MKLQPGIYLNTKEDLIDDQRILADDDNCKDFDFTSCDYWLTTDCGADPMPVHDVHDILPYTDAFDFLSPDDLPDIVNQIAPLIDLKILLKSLGLPND